MHESALVLAGILLGFLLGWQLREALAQRCEAQKKALVALAKRQLVALGRLCNQMARLREDYEELQERREVWWLHEGNDN